MSTVSRYVTSAKITPQALNSALIPLISLMFLSGVPRVFDPLVIPMWKFLFPDTMPMYLLQVSSIFGYLSVAAGIIKYFASDDLAEQLRVQGEIKTLGAEDLPILVFYLGAGYAILSVLGVPLTPIALTQTGVMLVLALFYVTIPWYLHKLFALPDSAKSLFLRTRVFIWTFLLATIATTVGLFVMRAAEFYL